MKKKDHSGLMAICFLLCLVCIAVAFYFVFKGFTAGDWGQKSAEPVPSAVTWAVNAAMVLPMIPTAYRAILRRRNPDKARDDELAENDERGKAISARADSTTLQVVLGLLTVAAIVLMISGRTTWGYIMMIAGSIIITLRTLIAFIYKKRM
jgi:uncharacterized membrane protein